MTEQEKKAYNQEILDLIDNIVQAKIEEYGADIIELYADVVEELKEYLKS